jgi:hypothetical protein
MRQGAVLLQTMLLLCSPGALAGDPLDARLRALDNLIERSASAQRIDAGGQPAARAKREEARQLRREAMEARTAGDPARAEALLGQATAAMVAASRLGQGGEAASEKDRQDYRQRAASLEAILAAQQRVARDQGREAEALEVARAVAALREQAETLAAMDNYRDGRLLLDMALEKAKLSLRGMKDGSTVAVRLDFSTPEQWYGYYLEKTGSQLRAIELLAARAQGSGRGRMAENLIADAREQRNQAERLAGEGRHEQANQILDRLLGRLTGGLMAVLN